MPLKYRNIFEFPPRWLFGRCPRRGVLLAGAIVPIIAVVVVDVAVAAAVVVVVLALSDRGPLVKHQMGTVITVRSTVLRVRVIGVSVRGSRSRRGRYVDPFLLPLPHRSIEDRGRSVPSRGPAESGPNTLHEIAAGSTVATPIRVWIKKGNEIIEFCFFFFG